MLEFLASQLELIAAHAPVWGFFLIFVFMAIESSFVPFPSEVVMIPAGFLAIRGELTYHSPFVDGAIALLVALGGCLLGAFINYYLGLKLGRPVLSRYGKYFFLKKEALDRADELFAEYGDITTFICRLVPVIRQIISIPAGITRMPIGRFAFFTGLGATVWNCILFGVGAFLGRLSLQNGEKMSYLELIEKGKELVSENYGIIAAGLILCIVLYGLIHRLVMRGKIRKTA